MIKNYKYDEISYAEKIYKENIFITKHIPTELRLLVLYYRDILKMKAKERKIALVQFCGKNIPNYNRASHYKIVNRALQKGSNSKQKLIKVEKVDIYKDEIEYINSLEIDFQYKKLLFAFLVQMRLNKIVSEFKNGKEYKSTYFKGGRQKYENIKLMANVSNKININDDFINQLSQGDTPLITSLHDGLINLNFLDKCKQTRDIIIEITDYENVGWYFDYYNHIDGVILCDYCNQPFKQRRKDSRFCDKHIEYQPIETKNLICIDCGSDVEISSRDNETCRCDECRDIHLKIIKQIQNKRHYNKIK